MSTKITQAYDAIVTRMGTLLPNHTRLSNPYQLDQNTEPALKQGWGLKVESGSNTNRHVNCQLSIERTLTIAITRKYYAMELNAASKATTEKDLLEDQFIVVKDFEKNSALEGIVARAIYTSDTGILFVFNEEKPFYKIETTFTIEYFESLT